MNRPFSSDQSRRNVVAPGKPRKYKIHDCLLKLNVVEHQIVMSELPKTLGICLNTFHNYRNILPDAKQDIPHCMVRKFELFFKLKPGELLNQKVEMISMEQLLKKHE